LPNTDAPRGLRVLKNPFGTTPQVKVYNATSAVIFRGQLVLLRSDGEVEGIDSSAVQTADVHILGTAAHYKAASAADSTMHVILDKGDLQYVIQSNDDTQDTPAEYIGANYITDNANAGSTLTGDSSMELDGATGPLTAVDDGGTGAAILRVVDIYSGVDNRVVAGDATESANADFVVVLNPAYLHFANSVGI